MGDDNVELLEQTVKHNAEDIKEVRLDFKDLKREFDEFKMKHTVVESNVNQIFTMLSKFDEKISGIETKMEQSAREQNEKWDKVKEDQNKELKGFMWKIAGVIVGAVFLTVLGLK